MSFKYYKHLNVPGSWERYFTKYPQGMTILEALFEWVSQVDSMVDHQNILTDNVTQFRNEIDAFVDRFDERLQTEVTQTLVDWQNSGFLDVVISEALQWQLDDYIATNEQDKLSLTAQLVEINQKYDTTYINPLFLDPPYQSAVGDGVADDTNAFKNAIQIAENIVSNTPNINGATIFIPAGTFNITDTLVLKHGKFISFLGTGKSSVLQWAGEDNRNLFYINDLADEQKISFKKIFFTSKGKKNGVKAIKTNRENGDITSGQFVVNVTIEENTFLGFDTPIEISRESDQFNINDNYFLDFLRYGVRCINGTNSNIHITKNHFRYGRTGSWAVSHVGGGSNIVIDGNTVQSGNPNAKAFYLEDVMNFRISSTYFECGGTIDNLEKTNFIELKRVNTGVIQNNVTTGNTGKSVIHIGLDCKNIEVGSNVHSVSGGNPLFSVFAEEKTTTQITGLQELQGSGTIKTVNDLSLFESVYRKNNLAGSTTEKIINIPVANSRGQVNVTNNIATTLTTITQEGGYLISVFNANNNDHALLFLTKFGGTNNLKTITESNGTYIKLTLVGNDLMVTQTLGSIRTFQFAVTKLH